MSRRLPNVWLAALAPCLPAMSACSVLFGWSDISDGEKIALSADSSTPIVEEAGASDVGQAPDAPPEAAAPLPVGANADYLELAVPGTYDVVLDDACVFARAMVWGAGGGSVGQGGGSGDNGVGGQGGFTIGTWPLGGRSLRVTVASPTGGGAGGAGNVAGGHGGGLSAVAHGDARFLIAGGGAGACPNHHGGAGGGVSGKPGDDNLRGSPGSTAGGAGGTDQDSGQPGQPGSSLAGGAGGGAAGHPWGGGGGGAGFFGGGGGGSVANNNVCGSGGGGSGFVDTSVVGLVGATASTNNGQVGNSKEPHRVALAAAEPGNPGLVLLFCGTACSAPTECGPAAHCSGGKCYPNGLDSPCQGDGECGGFQCKSGRCG